MQTCTHADGQTDRRTDGQTDGRTDGRRDGHACMYARAPPHADLLLSGRGGLEGGPEVVASPRHPSDALAAMGQDARDSAQAEPHTSQVKRAREFPIKDSSW